METQIIPKMEDSKYFGAEEYFVRYYEMDFNQVLKPSALLNFLQDTATKNAENFGFGPSFVFANNYAWFLIKYHIEFDEYPCALDKIIIKTEPRGSTKIIANRDFEIWTADNKRLARVASNWMLVNLANRSVLKLSEATPTMPVFEKRENDLQFEKLGKEDYQFNIEKTFEIRYDDIDVNQHVNNANYIVWAFEALPYEFKSKYKLKTLDMVYKKEIAFGHNIISKTQFSENNKESIHVLKNATTDEELCIVKAVWS